MKIRNGFVSNSSSSSFLVYGAWVPLDKALKAVNLTEEQLKEIEEDKYIAYDYLYGMDLYVTYDNEAYDGDRVMFGRSWCFVDDNETGLEFKQNIESKLREMFGEDINCETIDYTTYG